MAGEPRRGRWITPAYYYLAALVGLAILLVGLIGGLQGLVQAAFPKTSEDVRYASEPTDYGPEGEEVTVSEPERMRRRAVAIDAARLAGLGQALDGLVAGTVGAPVFLWHLKQARRREPEWLGSPPAAPARSPAPDTAALLPE